MGLLGNYSILNSNPGHEIGGFTNLYAAYKPGGFYNFYFGDHNVANSTIRACFPTGSQPSYSFLLAIKGAEMSSSTSISGNGNVSASLTKGVNMSTSLSGIGDITASMGLIAQMNASLSGSGTLVAAMVGVVSMQASLNGSGNVSAGLNLIANMVANLNGSGNITANLKGVANMEATIYVNQSEATIQDIVNGVWNGIAAAHNNPGTMGELLNNTGGGASPATIANAVWEELLASHGTPGTTGEKMQMLLSLAQFLGLK